MAEVIAFVSFFFIRGTFTAFFPTFFEELYELFIKAILPAIVAISIGIAVQSKKERITFLKILMSYVIGIGCVYLTSGIVMENFSNKMIPVVCAVIALTGEKIVSWFIFSFKFEKIGNAFTEAIIAVIKNWISKK